MKRHLRLIIKFTAVFWQIHSQYRLGAILWLLNGLIAPIIMMGVWLVVDIQTSHGFSTQQITTYFLLSMIIFRLTQTWLAEDLTEIIKDGTFSIFLVKPFSFIDNYLARDVSLRSLRILTLLPVIFISFWLVLHFQTITLSVKSVLVFILMIIIGYVLNFAISIMVGLSAFWTEQAHGSFLLLMLLTDLFAGILVPVPLMPQGLAQITTLLPFYAMVGFSIDFLMGNLDAQFVMKYFAQSLGWLLLFVCGAHYMYRKAIKNYSSVGI